MARNFLSTDAEASTSRYNGPGGRGLHHEFRHFRQQNLLLRLGKYTKALEVIFHCPQAPQLLAALEQEAAQPLVLGRGFKGLG